MRLNDDRGGNVSDAAALSAAISSESGEEEEEGRNESRHSLYVRRSLTTPTHPCAHQQRRRARFQPRPSRFSASSTGLQSDRTDTGE
ncbi:hypothetical protein ACFX19_021500 [Malus domestica]